MSYLVTADDLVIRRAEKADADEVDAADGVDLAVKEAWAAGGKDLAAGSVQSDPAAKAADSSRSSVHQGAAAVATEGITLVRTVRWERRLEGPRPRN